MYSDSDDLETPDATPQQSWVDTYICRWLLVSPISLRALDELTCSLVNLQYMRHQRRSNDNPRPHLIPRHHPLRLHSPDMKHARSHAGYHHRLRPSHATHVSQFPAFYQKEQQQDRLFRRRI